MKQRTQNNGRMGAKTSVYTPAIPEYLTAEVLELAGGSRAHPSVTVHALMHRRICASKVSRLSINNQPFRRDKFNTPVHATIAVDGVMPFIHKSSMVSKG
jgi:histone H2A